MFCLHADEQNRRGLPVSAFGIGCLQRLHFITSDYRKVMNDASLEK
jgi:hypothetical protein